MTLPKSKAEKEIRAALVAFLRVELPSARVVHEMNVAMGLNRIDVAAVTPNRLFLFEIKSAKDKLVRLKDQAEVFSRCSHLTVVIAHEKFFDVHEKYGWTDPVKELRDGAKHCEIWKYPYSSERRERWELHGSKYKILQHPKAFHFLHLLWADELKAEIEHCGKPFKGPKRKADMIFHLSNCLTGAEVTHAVCRQLRARDFAHADAPIPLTYEKAAA
ncbi:sce7726 family protein [Pseudovibrio ascidiaceicola]|uniref:sce7726 family protein n=1 Tax=Pseudovibrio ascidiaceicola TaxID=285279 RepID=UPI003D360679